MRAFTTENKPPERKEQHTVETQNYYSPVFYYAKEALGLRNCSTDIGFYGPGSSNVEDTMPYVLMYRPKPLSSKVLEPSA
eukprot:4235065-Amphidinium_carterae.1